MNDTKNESNQKKPSQIARPQSGETQHTGSSNSLAPSQETKPQSKSLSTNVAEHLLHLMTSVTKADVNPQTVNAACNCATQMINLMKLNIKLRDM